MKTETAAIAEVMYVKGCTPAAKKEKREKKIATGKRWPGQSDGQWWVKEGQCISTLQVFIRAQSAHWGIKHWINRKTGKVLYLDVGVFFFWGYSTNNHLSWGYIKTSLVPQSCPPPFFNTNPINLDLLHLFLLSPLHSSSLPMPSI